MNNFACGFLLATILWLSVAGIMAIDSRREYRKMESEAFRESYEMKKKNKQLLTEIRYLYNKR